MLSRLPPTFSPVTTALALVLCFSTTVLLASTANAEQTIEGVEQDIQSTEQRLKKLDEEIKASRALKQKLAQALKDTEMKVGERQSRIKGLNQDIERYNAQLNKLDEQIQSEQSQVELRKQVLAESIRRAQRLGASTGLKVALQNDNPAEADRIGVYTAYFMRAQQNAIARQQENLSQISAAHAEALKNRNWLNHIKKKAANQFNTYKGESTNQKKTIAKVQSKITSKTQTVAELKLDQERLQVLMEELRAAQVAKSGYFLSGQGNYPLPVKGTIQARFGDVKSVGKLRWNGYFITAPAGTAVRSIADGSVVYSDWLQGFGMLVIVDHGDNYMTLYGGNRNVAVRKEDWVESGATIATVGDSGGQKSSGVYFEIRHNAKPIDPKEWVSARNGVKSAKK